MIALAAAGRSRRTVFRVFRLMFHRSAAPAPDWESWVGKDVLVLTARLPTGRFDVGATRRIARELQSEIAAARVVVIDLRDRDDDERRLLASIIDRLPATRTWPTVRSIT